jgi:hypothetical protein
LRSLSVELRDFALRAKRALDEDIRSYPTPIPRCDAQFNAAYEQRSRLTTLLPRLDAAMNGNDTERLGAMADFLALPFIGESSDERSLRASIAEALSSAGVGTEAKPGPSAVDIAADAR